MIKRCIFLLPLNIYFFYKSYILIFYLSNLIITFKLFLSSFFKINNLFFSFIFTKKSYFIAFLKYYFFNLNKFNNIYFFKLKLKGLGYRVFKICTNLFKFFFIRTNFFYLHLPQNINLKIKNRKLLFFGKDLHLLKIVIINILLLNKTFIYFIRGLLFPRQIIILKPGKKRL
jgi:hypothetical protein